MTALTTTHPMTRVQTTSSRSSRHAGNDVLPCSDRQQGPEASEMASHRSGDSGSTAAAANVSTARTGGNGFDRKGVGNGALNGRDFSSRWAVSARHVLMVVLNKLPASRLKTKLFRKVFGMTIGADVALAYGVLIDPYDPAMVEIGENVIIGYDSKIFVHTFTLNRQRVRPVKIGSNVLIGGFCVIAPGVKIGDGASIAPGTIVTRNVPAGAIVTGNQMNVRKRAVR